MTRRPRQSTPTFSYPSEADEWRARNASGAPENAWVKHFDQVCLPTLMSPDDDLPTLRSPDDGLPTSRPPDDEFATRNLFSYLHQSIPDPRASQNPPRSRDCVEAAYSHRWAPQSSNVLPALVHSFPYYQGPTAHPSSTRHRSPFPHYSPEASAMRRVLPSVSLTLYS